MVKQAYIQARSWRHAWQREKGAPPGLAMDCDDAVWPTMTAAGFGSVSLLALFCLILRRHVRCTVCGADRAAVGPTHGFTTHPFFHSMSVVHVMCVLTGMKKKPHRCLHHRQCGGRPTVVDAA